MRQFVFWGFLLLIAAAVGGSIAYAARPWVDAANALSTELKQKLPAPVRATFTPQPTATGARSRVVATPTLPPPPVKPSGRTNFLLLASDNDKKNAPNTFPNTQVIIFVSYDTIHHQVYVISIPRDLWVPIPGFQTDKIDTAPGYDNLSTVVKTVEVNFRVTVDHYAWVGLTGFVKIINSLGGIDLVVTHPMVENDFPDDLNPLSSPYAIRRFYIPAGPQHLDGVTALQYVRARHADLIGDFGRSERQQQVLLQLKTKLKGMDISGFPAIIQDLKGEFKSDLSAFDVLGLAFPLLSLKSSDIHRYFLDQPHGYTTDTTTPDGKQAILQPNWVKINSLFSCVMSDQAYKGCGQ